MYAVTQSMVSAKLCVGMLVARPTAIPVAPLTSKFGNLPGNMSGSFRLSSKFRLHVTVFFSISLSSSMLIGLSLDSV